MRGEGWGKKKNWIGLHNLSNTVNSPVLNKSFMKTNQNIVPINLHSNIYKFPLKEQKKKKKRKEKEKKELYMNGVFQGMSIWIGFGN